MDNDPKNYYALIVGINYVGKSHSLNGCVRDALRMTSLLTNFVGVPRDNITLLTDAGESDNTPIAYNIRQALEWLTVKSKTASCVIFHFSGHGSRTVDRDGDEEDGLDEFIVPLDYPRSYITDDELYMRLFVPAKSNVIAFIDACHSGTAGDLYYQYNSESNSFKTSGRIETSTYNYDQVLISGCKDNQTSVDYFDNNLKQYGGAMTNSFINTFMANNQRITYRNLLAGMYKFLDSYNMGQKPQLTCNRKININSLFSLSPGFQYSGQDDAYVEEEIPLEETKKYIEKLQTKNRYLEMTNKELREKLQKLQNQLVAISKNIDEFKDIMKG